jgi:AGZA family xanthine/uracil permease-like MFS transporter
MAYILVVNPHVLRLARNGNDWFDGADAAMPFESIATATALSASLGCFAVGLLGNLPFGLAAGMGMNSCW